MKQTETIEGFQQHNNFEDISFVRNVSLNKELQKSVEKLNPFFTEKWFRVD